jgi:hypothetical protein
MARYFGNDMDFDGCICNKISFCANMTLSLSLGLGLGLGAVDFLRVRRYNKI